MGVMHVRRQTTQEWADQNPILTKDQMALETDTGVFRIGDGETRWSKLEPYSQGKGGSAPGGAATTLPETSGSILLVLSATGIDGPIEPTHPLGIELDETSENPIDVAADGLGFSFNRDGLYVVTVDFLRLETTGLILNEAVSFGLQDGVPMPVYQHRITQANLDAEVAEIVTTPISEKIVRITESDSFTARVTGEGRDYPGSYALLTVKITPLLYVVG